MRSGTPAANSTPAAAKSAPVEKVVPSKYEYKTVLAYCRTALRRCKADARQIAALIARRTTIPPDAILKVLLMPRVGDEEIGTWFG